MLLSHAVGELAYSELTCRAVRPMLVPDSRCCNLISVGGVSYADRASAGRDCLQRLLVYLYIKTGLSQCVSTGVAWMDGRSRAAGTGKAASYGSGGGGAWLTKCAGTSKAGQTGKPTAQIEPKSRWLVRSIVA